MRHKIIVNPVAGRGTAEGRIPELEQLLRGQGIEYELECTQRPMHAAELARLAAEQGFQVVVAVGGDGTSNEVLNGLMEVKRGSGGIPAMGILCVGRGNDFAYGAGVPGSLEEGCAVLARGHRQPMDVGRLWGGDFPEGRYFGNGIGVGFDTIVGLEAAKMKWAKGFLGYVIGALKTLSLYYRAPKVRIVFGQDPIEQKSIQISVMNGRRMGGTFFMAPEARNDDGLLDLCIADEMPRLAMLGLILMYMKGTQAGSPHIRTGRGRTAEIQALDGELVVHADGETIGIHARHLRVECLPGAVQMICRPPQERQGGGQ
jgi:YegS/Rv2252/BmrU family lipid kinase